MSGDVNITDRWAKVLKVVGKVDDASIIAVLPARVSARSEDPLLPAKAQGQLVLTSQQLFFFRTQKGRSDIVLRRRPIKIDIGKIAGLEVDSEQDGQYALKIEHGRVANLFDCKTRSEDVVAFTSALAALSDGSLLPLELPLDHAEDVRVKEGRVYNFFLFLLIVVIAILGFWLTTWTF